MSYVKIDDGRLYYEEYGSGQPLLLIAGMGGVGSYWKPQIEEFSKRFRVIVFDQRGTGKSSRSKVEYSIPMLAQDTSRLLDQLNIQSAHVCGHSTGGMIAQYLAIHAPTRIASLTLFGTRGFADEFTRRAMGFRRQLLLQGEIELFVQSTPLFLYPSKWITENTEHIKKQEAIALASIDSAEIMASRISAVINHDQLANLPQIKSPTLVTCAKDDFLTPVYYSTQLADLIPGAILQLIEHGGHACSMTNKDEFNRVLAGFLSQS